MVLEYYNLREQPFGVTPDPRYLYASATHREALGSLLYGLEAGRGFVALIAQPGMGKTTLLFQALNHLKDKAKAVFIFQTISTPVDFLGAVLADLGVHEIHGNLIELQTKLNEVVTEQARLGKPLVVVIDEAQNLDDSVLELIRMLSNFETSQEKLIQIVLSGQPQLAAKLASPEFLQLRQRISIFGCLKPLAPVETALYIEHRLQVAGHRVGAPLFTRGAVAMIAENCGGVPRNINNLCFNAMSLGCALRRRTIDCEIVREVIADLDLESLQKRISRASQPEEGGEKEVPAFASVMSAPSFLTGSVAKFIAVCAILLVLGGALLQGHRWMMAKTVVHANRVLPPPVPSRSSFLSLQQNPQRATLVKFINVKAGQSLSQICIENFGCYNSERAREMQKLNPWLRNLDHIESGQKIRIPVVEQISSPAQRDIAQSCNALLAERSRP
jgi:type II secretory pathway predicted ATPase ExeA